MASAFSLLVSTLNVISSKLNLPDATLVSVSTFQKSTSFGIENMFKPM
jgi:hypothetical protein